MKISERVVMGFLKWTGAAMGVSGAFMVASNNEVSGYGYIPFLIGAIFIVIAFARQKEWSMVFLHGIYGAINLYGIFKWLIL